MLSFKIWGALRALPLALACASLAPSQHPAQSKLVFSHALPRMDGVNLQAKAVTVTYPPGGASPVHSHPCPVIGYVIEGSLKMQVKGEPETIYKVGETFYEAPNGVHAVSANASPDRPATFIAFFVCDHDTPLSVAAPAGIAPKEK